MSVPCVCDPYRTYEHVFIQNVSEKDALSRNRDDVSIEHFSWRVRYIRYRGEGFLSREYKACLMSILQ